MVLKVPEEGRSVKRRGLGFGVWGSVVLALVLVLVFVRRSPAAMGEILAVAGRNSTARRLHLRLAGLPNR